MPVHDWIRVEAGIFHHFHHDWITEIARAFNRGLLPPAYYALAEQIAGGMGPDVLTLQRPTDGSPEGPDLPSGAGLAVATAPPRAQFHGRTELDQYATKAKAVVIHHCSNHQVVAVAEIVSPGNKSNRHGLRAFVDKAVELLRAGVHLLIVDLFPPGRRDPQGIPKAVWDEFADNDFALPPGKPLSLGAYVGGPCPEVFIESAAVGEALPDTPLFLNPDFYVPAPLEATYRAAWEGVPSFWREVLERS